MTQQATPSASPGTTGSAWHALSVEAALSFGTIVKAVELGRALYDNLVRYIRYQMAGLFGFIATFVGASLFFIAEGIPFTPLQTLWINFTVTVFLAVGLGYGKAREGLMAEKPRAPEAAILPTRSMAYLVFIGLVLAVSTLGVIWWATEAYDEAVARTMGVTVFSLANVWFALETSEPQRSLFSGGIFENPTLIKAAGAALLATIAAVELGVLNRLLGTVGLSVEQWITCVVVSLAVIVAAEGAKLLHVASEPEPERTALPAAA